MRLYLIVEIQHLDGDELNPDQVAEDLAQAVDEIELHSDSSVYWPRVRYIRRDWEALAP